MEAIRKNVAYARIILVKCWINEEPTGGTIKIEFFGRNQHTLNTLGILWKNRIKMNTINLNKPGDSFIFLFFFFILFIQHFCLSFCLPLFYEYIDWYVNVSRMTITTYPKIINASMNSFWNVLLLEFSPLFWSVKNSILCRMQWILILHLMDRFEWVYGLDWTHR